jgi:hypothetical protein
MKQTILVTVLFALGIFLYVIHPVTITLVCMILDAALFGFNLGMETAKR